MEIWGKNRFWQRKAANSATTQLILDQFFDFYRVNGKSWQASSKFILQKTTLVDNRLSWFLIFYSMVNKNSKIAALESFVREITNIFWNCQYFF